MPFSSDKILADIQRENAKLKEEQIRLNGQLRNYVVANQKLVHENQVLLDENQELSELCLYLDDERIRLLKMIEEWEKCGRYYFEKLSVSWVWTSHDGCVLCGGIFYFYLWYNMFCVVKWKAKLTIISLAAGFFLHEFPIFHFFENIS